MADGSDVTWVNMGSPCSNCMVDVPGPPSATNRTMPNFPERERALLGGPCRKRDYSPGAKHKRVAAQSESDPKKLGRAAIRIARPVKTTFTLQVSHVDTHAVINTAGKVVRKLKEPHLSHRSPFTARRPP